MTKAPLVTLQRAFQSDHSLGRRTLNTEPLPGSLLTVMSPPIIWQSATLALIAQKQPIRRHDYYVYFLGVPAAKVPTSFDELRGGTRGSACSRRPVSLGRNMSKRNRTVFDEGNLEAMVRLREQDEKFCQALRAAIQRGRESRPTGVSTEPCPQRPILNYTRPD